MLHILYLTADEYTRAGMPDFMMSNAARGVDFQWTDMLAYLPNPTNQPLPDRFTGYSVLHLLPSYERPTPTCAPCPACGQRSEETFFFWWALTCVVIVTGDGGGGGGRRSSYAVGALCQRNTVTLTKDGVYASQVSLGVRPRWPLLRGLFWQMMAC